MKSYSSNSRNSSTRRSSKERKRKSSLNDDSIDKKCSKLFVANINPGVSGNELRKLFENYGKLIECEKIADKGYAFVVRIK